MDIDKLLLIIGMGILVLLVLGLFIFTIIEIIYYGKASKELEILLRQPQKKREKMPRVVCKRKHTFRQVHGGG